MMETKKQDAVIYIDGYGREHDALVTAVNEREQGFVTLVYVDVNAPEPENVKKLFDIAHVSHASKQEPNPDLPSYDVNAWKQRGELHRALPADHPAFDHPFLLPKLDEAGNVIPIDRPKTVAEVQSHQDAMVKRMGIDAPAKVDEFSQPKPVLVSAGPDLDRVAAFLQSRGYSIEDCHTAAKFLDSLQPHQAAAFKKEFDQWCTAHPAEQQGLPSAEDLDADAEEQKIKAATAPTAPILINTPEATAPQTSALPDPSPEQLVSSKVVDGIRETVHDTPAGPMLTLSVDERDGLPAGVSPESKPEAANDAPAEEGQTD
jgi:hypothetical protein